MTEIVTRWRISQTLVPSGSTKVPTGIAFIV